MTCANADSAVLVPLDQGTAAKLLRICKQGEPVQDALKRLISAAEPRSETELQQSDRSASVAAPAPTPSTQMPHHPDASTSTLPCSGRDAQAPKGRYKALVLGTPVYGNTWYELYGNVIDLFADLASEALEGLAERPNRTRRYVAKDRKGLYCNGQRLRAHQTRSGWWISANVGRTHIAGALRALAKAADLEFGRDIQLPVA